MNNQQTKHIGAAAPFWLRGPIALTADRWLVLDRAQAVEYQPVVDAQGRASVFDLASIHQPKDAVRFAEQHGLLWHEPDTPDLRELFTDWWEEANDLRKTLDLCLGCSVREQATAAFENYVVGLGGRKVCKTRTCLRKHRCS